MRAPRSLRWRLLAATLVGLGLALVLAGFALQALFRQHVQRQFEVTLVTQLDQVTAYLDFDAQGQPRVDSRRLWDPRWERPYSGLYWQLDAAQPAEPGPAVLRSRSLWDAQLTLPPDVLSAGDVHVHAGHGPAGEALLIVERTVRKAGAGDARWRLAVAAAVEPMEAALRGFARVLAASLASLLLLLGLAAWAQVVLGLRPLRALQRGLQDVQQARRARLEGRFPAELQPLVDDFNRVLDQNAEVVARSRTQAGNLAHALKTPLAVIAQVAAAAPPGNEWAPQVLAQVDLAHRQVDWHLARARLSGGGLVPGRRCAVGPVVQGLLRVMARVHGDRAVNIRLEEGEGAPDFAGDEQDLQEILGNLLDNASKWARGVVRVFVGRTEGAASRLRIVVEDDGPGIEAGQLERATARGVRLDESVPGSGWGLAIVRESVQWLGGALHLDRSPLGGLRAVVELPAAP